ncbi:hypothetical protein KAFR_0C05510 [Kazachstania africana CBS 2517]|uniref:EamA domain-containing protein n=1 Tax=Kazachstania africana (strain ATCC 22294 / BCRC 22015 / CBS 2517 / CECT 1963 / NBRC 1671 / NRRL Y-8276) TaxID=1071382 RepID=H2AT42_KAZAF|nr:hypothetical protein KAFR_0C05510 [Kazachstania africana CBS 2517]CCF57542.1 hypothetical protein KAFR_0C05510 [Kazachstania africana CBS 2517]
MISVSDFNKRWTLGLIMLAVVILLWVLSSFLINTIFEDNSYRKPFLITYINTAAFIFYLLPTLKKILINYHETGTFSIHHQLIIAEEGENYSAISSHLEEQASRNLSPESPLIPKNASQTIHDNNHILTNISTQRLSLKETIRLSAQFCILWFLANLATNASLAYTSVASQTILSSTSSFFTLFIGALCQVETLNHSKIVGSIISFGGIILVTHSDANHKHVPYKPGPGIKDVTSPFSGKTSMLILFGNFLAIAGALFYGVYSTLLKLQVKDEDRINMKIFFGFVGLFTLIFLWPSIILLHFLNIETFEIPRDPRILCIVGLNCIITFISDFCWAKAMLLTSPLTVTVGLSITIPVAMFGDFIFKHKSMPFLYLIGASLILGSFYLINKSSGEDNLEQHVQDN